MNYINVVSCITSPCWSKLDHDHLARALILTRGELSAFAELEDGDAQDDEAQAGELLAGERFVEEDA